MLAQNSQAGSFVRLEEARSTRAEILSSTVMFARNDTMTTRVLHSGELASPVSRMELRKVSMLQAQKHAMPKYRHWKARRPGLSAELLDVNGTTASTAPPLFVGPHQFR